MIPGSQLIVTDEILSNLTIREVFLIFSQTTLCSSGSKDTKAPAAADAVCPSTDDTEMWPWSSWKEGSSTLR